MWAHTDSCAKDVWCAKGVAATLGMAVIVVVTRMEAEEVIRVDAEESGK